MKTSESRRAVAYVTAWTKDERNEQRQVLRAYAAEERIDVLEWHEDAVAPARPIEERTAIVGAIEAVARLNAGVLLVHSYDDVSPDELVIAAIAGLAKLRGAVLLAAKTKVFQLGIEDARVAKITGVVASLVGRTRGAKRRRTNAELQKQGKPTGGIPYGLRVSEDGTLERDDAEWKVIAFARSQRAKGVPFERIAKQCNERGFRSRVGKPFHDMQIKRMVEAEGKTRGRIIMSTPGDEPRDDGDGSKSDKTPNAA